jgi:hypothetical protein
MRQSLRNCSAVSKLESFIAFIVFIAAFIGIVSFIADDVNSSCGLEHAGAESSDRYLQQEFGRTPHRCCLFKCKRQLQ